MATKLWLSLFVVAAVPFAQSACTQVECGDGTVEEDGECIPANIDPDNALCGDGAILEDGVCVPASPTSCDPETTVAVVDPLSGHITCQGTGAAIGCTGAITCPAPDSGKVTICGQLFDVETDEKLSAPDATGAVCDPDAPTDDGPCSIVMKVHDAIALAGAPDPRTAAETTYSSSTIDDCGRFAVVSILRPATPGFVGLASDDNPESGNDNYVLGGVALGTQENQRITGFPAYTVRSSTNEAWSTSAGVDPTFAEQGVYVPIYHYQDEPVTGVQVLIGGDPADADDVFYFTDDDAQRTTPTAGSTETGANGTALVLNSGLVGHSGSNGDTVPKPCEFGENLAASIGNLVFVQVKDALLDGTTEDLCP